MATGAEAASPDRILGGSRDRCWPRVPNAGLPNGVSGGLSSVTEVRDTVGGGAERSEDSARTPFRNARLGDSRLKRVLDVR